MKHWTPQQVADAAGAALANGSARTTGPESVTIDSRSAGPGALFVGLPGTRHDGGAFASAALEAGAWGVLVAREHAVVLADPGRGLILSAADPLRAAAGAGHHMAARGRGGWDPSHRRDRFDRQDFDQGSAPGCPAPPPKYGRLPGQLQHRDWRSARDPRGAARDRGACPRDGDAWLRSDRRAGSDRRARCGRDRQRRPGPPRASRHRGECGRGQS
jgi:hypothetical protein